MSAADLGKRAGTPCLALLVALVLLPGAVAAREADVVAYRFGVEVTDFDDLVRGVAVIDVRLGPGQQTLELDLEGVRPDGRGMRVSEAEWLRSAGGSEPLRVTHGGSSLRLEHSEWSERVIVRIRYSGRPSDGFLIGTNRHGDRTFFADHWPDRAQRWLPVVDHPSDKALCSFEVTAPSHYQVVGCGALREETDLGDGRRRTLWASRAPMATKVMAVGIARFAVETVGTVQGVPVQTWVFPQDRDAGFSDYAVALPVLHFFSERLGPFPYAKLANVQSKTRWGGLENASNVFYNESSVRGDGSSEGLIAHEIAHQWFGDAVSETDWQHVWLSEGFATYLTQVYLEFAHGRDRLREGMSAARSRVIDFSRQRPDARIVDPTIEDPSRQLSAATYQKGAWVLHMLRSRLGDRAFFDSLRTFYASYRDGNASTEDFVDVAERVSGDELSGFFDQWLRSPGHPLLRIGERREGTALVLEVEQMQERVFDFPLKVAVSDRQGARTTRLVEVRDRRTAVRFEDVADAVSIDPEVELLFELSP